MAQSLREFLEREPAIKPTTQRCANPECNVVLSGAVTGRESGPNGNLCSDCYFDALGEIVEQHPIGRTVGMRGTTAN